MLVVQPTEQQAYGQCIDFVLSQSLVNLLTELVECLRRQRFDHAAAVIDPFVDAKAIGAPDKRFGLLPLRVVYFLSVDALDEGDILKAAGRDAGHLRAVPLYQSVCGDRRPENQEVDLRRWCFGLPQDTPDGKSRSGRCRRNLGHNQLPGVLVRRNKVSECAARIDTDAKSDVR